MLANRPSLLTRQRVSTAWLFLAPMLIVLAATAAWPLLRTIYFSLTDLAEFGQEDYRFVWFENYLFFFAETGEWFGLFADSLWWRSVWNTLLFTVISVSLETVLGILIALALNLEFRGRGLIRAAILIPWAIPTIVSAQMWKWMLNDQFGIINDLLIRIGVLSEPIAWTASPDTALFAIIMVDVWKTTPFMALLTLAALQLLPGEVYEAARVDGIRPLKRFFSITLPLIKQPLMVAVIFRSLDSLRIFDLIYVLTPNNEATMSMSVYSKLEMFDFSKFAYGAAASTSLFLIITILTLLYISIGKVRLGQ